MYFGNILNPRLRLWQKWPQTNQAKACGLTLVGRYRMISAWYASNFELWNQKLFQVFSLFRLLLQSCNLNVLLLHLTLPKQHTCPNPNLYLLSLAISMFQYVSLKICHLVPFSIQPLHQKTPFAFRLWCWHLGFTPASHEWHLPGASKAIVSMVVNGTLMLIWLHLTVHQFINLPEAVHHCHRRSSLKLVKKSRGVTFTWSRSSIVHHWFITVTSLDSPESQIHLEGEQFEVERKAPVSQCRICSLEGLWCVRVKLVLMKGFLCSYYVPITFAGDTRTSQIRFGWSKISSHLLSVSKPKLNSTPPPLRRHVSGNAP